MIGFNDLSLISIEEGNRGMIDDVSIVIFVFATNPVYNYNVV